MKFEWDEEKAAANLRKHGVSFAEASTIFADDLSLTGDDPDHSRGEHRFVTFGVSSTGRLLVLSHAERSPAISVSSAHGQLHEARGNFMNKPEKNTDELRPEYRREDFGKMTRGKYAKQVKAASNVVVLAPEVAKAFPNGEAVNQALMGLLEIAKTAHVKPRTARK